VRVRLLSSLVHNGTSPRSVLGPVWATPFISSWSKFVAAVGAFALTLLIAMVSWRYFELPFVRIGHKFNYHLEERPEEILVEVATL
jgi:peptidoglycan/LPS O-acetylase OafA/YrhL